nr:hypothetical protein [Tanacetum cinerariifolium]
ITHHHRFIARMRDEIRTSTNLVSQLNALFAELEDKVADFNRFIVVAEENIHGKEIDLEMLEAEGLFRSGVAQIEFCFRVDAAKDFKENMLIKLRLLIDAAGTKCCCWEYGKPDEIKLSVTFDTLNRISGKHRALFSSFLGDIVREHIGLKILSRKKRYFDVDLPVRKLVKSAAAKMACSKSIYQHTMGREDKKKPDEEPAHGTLWLKGRVNKDEEYPDDEIRSKETEDKIKEGTLKFDHGTDAMIVVLGKKKGRYTIEVGSGVRYKSTDEDGATKIHGCENDASI